jgi:hypothetical protein
MWELDQAIAEWRKQMLAAGISSPVPLGELENHLRDEVERLMASGMDAQTAFQAAVVRIGHPYKLRLEFAKAASTKVAMSRKLKAGLLQFFGLTPVASFKDFTSSARESLAFAGEEPRRFHHVFVGTEHVLLGLLRLEGGIVARVLGRIGVDCQTVREKIEMIVGMGSAAITSPSIIPYTPRAKRALQLAAREAAVLRQPHVGAEHIFLGLLLEGDGVAALVLKSLGVDANKARREILRESNRQPGQN